MLKFKLLAPLALISALVLTGCKLGEPSSDSMQAEQTAQLSKAASEQVGMPNITNFQEKRFLKQIYEMRDQQVSTYTYIIDMNGKSHFVCNSIGFGINASVQYSNPERIASSITSKSFGTVQQPEPNGLFPPSGQSATYVLCSKDGKVVPVYLEPEILVSPFKLDIK